MPLTNVKLSTIFGVVKFMQVIVQVSMIVFIGEQVLPPNPDILAKYKICAYIFLSINSVFVIGYAFFEKTPVTTFHSEALIFLVMLLICFFVGLSELLHISKYKIVEEKRLSLLYMCVLCYNPLLLIAVELFSVIAYCFAPKNLYSTVVGAPENNQTDNSGLIDDNKAIPLTPSQNLTVTIENTENGVNHRKVSVEGKPKIPIRNVQVNTNPKICLEDKPKPMIQFKRTNPITCGNRVESFKVINGPSAVPPDDSVYI